MPTLTPQTRSRIGVPLALPVSLHSMSISRRTGALGPSAHHAERDGYIVAITLRVMNGWKETLSTQPLSSDEPMPPPERGRSQWHTVSEQELVA